MSARGAQRQHQKESCEVSCAVSHADNDWVRLEVHNATPSFRADELISNSVPVPRDLRVMDVTGLALSDEHGRPVDAQFRALAWWPEGSVKWVLVSFLTTVDAKATRSHHLEFFAGKKRGQPRYRSVGANGDSGQLKVDTGQLRFVMGKTGGKLIDQLCLQTPGGWMDLCRQGGYLGSVVRQGGQDLLLGSVGQLVVNDNGPERLDVTATGSYVTGAGRATQLSYIIRIIAHRDGRSLRIFHTLRNTGARVRLQGVAFQIPCRPSSVRVRHEQATVYSCDLEEGGAVGVLQDQPDCFYAGALDDADACASTQGRFSGWITAIDEESRSAVSAAIRHFWQTYPKSLEADADCLRVGLLPDKTRNFDSFLPAGQVTSDYVLEQGESRTHEFLLYFRHLDSKEHEEDSGRDTEAAVVSQFQEPLYCLAPWSWYVASGALGDLCCRDFERFGEYERGIDESLASVLERRNEEKLYGDRNYGDDRYRTIGAWNNCEYDYPHVGMMMFLRGCGREWYDEFAMPAARHMINIDTINAGPDSGKVYHHDNSFSSEVLGHSSHGHGDLGSHAWIQGVLEYYAFSGDFLARDVALSTANRWADDTLARYRLVESGALPAERMYGTERQWGWTNVSIMAAYNLFPEDKFLRTAESLMDIAMKLQEDNGLLGGFFERHGFAGILMGSPVVDSIVMFYQATGRSEVRDFLVRLGRALCKYGWVDPPGAWAYHANHRDYRMTSDRNLAPAVGYAYHYSDAKEDDAVLWERAERGFRRSWAEATRDGKTTAQAHRFALRMLALMSVYGKDNGSTIGGSLP